MSRRSRRTTEETDPMDLLLDTVSNVFGGVMFLTLLAALLILTRGASSMEVAQTDRPDDTNRKNRDARIVELEIQQIELALKSQQMLQARLDRDGSTVDKTKQLAGLQDAVAATTAEIKTAASDAKQQQDRLEDRQAAQKAIENDAERLAEELASEIMEVEKMRKSAQRTVKFRPLRRIMTAEATLILRYGKFYLFQKSPRARDFNRDDFFVIEKTGSSMAITPKPHRGQLVSEASVAALVDQLRVKFPAGQFHATIAVWDDSFDEFNTLRDGLSSAGYVYRTITADDATVLSFGAADSFGQ